MTLSAMRSASCSYRSLGAPTINFAWSFSGMRLSRASLVWAASPSISSSEVGLGAAAPDSISIAPSICSPVSAVASGTGITVFGFSTPGSGALVADSCNPPPASDLLLSTSPLIASAALAAPLPLATSS
ncbi:MAG: hypothetical protein AAF652_09105 [Cyanobacteria bacterium P01_C01_bin.72]